MNTDKIEINSVEVDLGDRNSENFKKYTIDKLIEKEFVAFKMKLFFFSIPMLYGIYSLVLGTSENSTDIKFKLGSFSMEISEATIGIICMIVSIACAVVVKTKIKVKLS